MTSGLCVHAVRVHMHPPRHANTHMQRRALAKMFEIPDLWLLLDPSGHQMSAVCSDTEVLSGRTDTALTMAFGIFPRCLSFGLSLLGPVAGSLRVIEGFSYTTTARRKDQAVLWLSDWTLSLSRLWVPSLSPHKKTNGKIDRGLED